MDQNPTIVDVKQPGKFANGGYIWLVRFELPSAAARDGWIVQEFFKAIVHTHAGASAPKSYHYWEAWPVKRGAKLISEPGYHASFQGSAPFNDVFGDRANSGSIPANSAGTIVIQAAARFYEVSLPAQFVKQLPAALGQELPQTYVKPGFWKGAGSFRYLHYAWDFTASPSFPHPVLRTAAAANRAVFVGSISPPQPVHTWA
jgi:hypothetical protein